MMIRVENVPSEIMNEAGDPGDNASAVLAMNQQNDGLFLMEGHDEGCAPELKPLLWSIAGSRQHAADIVSTDDAAD
jgi:hypothetical protein